jgi:molecular chaperone GrpE (heat shock protein)
MKEAQPGLRHDIDLPLAKQDAALQYMVSEYQSFVRGIGGLLDGLERWREDAGERERQRLDLLRRQAESLLLQHGIRPTARAGQALDLKYHEVIAVEAAPDLPADTVLRISEMGYEMVLPGQGPVTLRLARVVVSGHGAVGVGPQEPVTPAKED